MKLVSFVVNGRHSMGVVDDEEIADVGAVLGGDLKALLAADGLARARDAVSQATRIPLADAALLPVIPNPGKIFCVGHNYETHRQETGRDKTEHPSIFVRFADSQIGHGAPLLLPAVSTMFD